MDDKNECNVKKSKNVKGQKVGLNNCPFIFLLFSLFTTPVVVSPPPPPPPSSSPLSHSSDEITPLVDDKTSTQTTSNRNRNFIREDQN